MKLVYSKTVNLVSMLALLCMLVLPYLAPVTVNATGVNADQGLGSPQSPTLVITKTDANGNPIQGVKYQIIQTHSYNPDVDYANAFTTPVSGAKAIEGTTDKHGKVIFTKNEGLELGLYTVKEISGPEGIVLNEFTVKIPEQITSGNQAGKLDYKVGNIQKTEYIKGSVELTKVDENQNPLAGVQFELYKKGANGAYEKINAETTFTTNESGKIRVDGLYYGDYYFVETKAPTGYVLNKKEIEFSITKNGEVIQKNWVNFAAPTITKDVEGATNLDMKRDTEYTYNLTVDLPTNIDEYKTFVVTDTLDARLTYADKWSVTGVNEESITFAKSATNDGQEVLTWTVNNISALKDVKQIVISFEAKIKPDAVLVEGETGIPNDATLQFDNGFGGVGTPTSPTVTVNPTDVEGDEGQEGQVEGLKIIKVDADDHNVTLAGAEFKLTTDENGEKVANANDTAIKVNGQSVDKLEGLATNENGEILIENLPAGTYYLHETKAPTYTDEEGNVQDYKMLTSAIEVAISDDKLTEVKVENSKSGWDLPQTGGLGTVLFTVIGEGLMLFAFVALKRRKNEPTNV